MATLRGEPVDRPPVSFYEINGLDEDPADPDPFNIYSHRSWQPLLDLARDRSDRIVMRPARLRSSEPDPLAELTTVETWLEHGSRITTRRIVAGGRTLVSRTRRDPDVNTVWSEDHLLKDTADLRDYLDLPQPMTAGEAETAPVLEAEAALGESGIVMIDTPDPLCLAASLFAMEDFTVIALTERELFTRLLDRLAEPILARTEIVARALPGRLWRIFGPEYASPPYLPPRLFRDYVCRYVGPMVASIQRHRGFARIHSHGRLRDIIDDIASMRPDGLDPIEPPPQGDVELAWVRERYGDSMVLFGNLEASDLENVTAPEFAAKVRRALDEGTRGVGRGFVLMPSACPYGRVLSPRAMRNYELMIELAEAD